MNTKVKIAPSILASDFGRLTEEVQAVSKAGADYIHVDVMDGQFVPNISIGPAVVKAAAAATGRTVDVHLMIVDPDRYLEQFAEAGADIITVHAEACTHLHRTVQRIHDLGKRAGVALNPATPLEGLRWILNDIDLVLIMSVNPGFGGQSFIANTLERLRVVRQWIDAMGRPIDLEVDGGVTADNAGSIAMAGADVLVAGTSVFKANDYDRAIRHIRERAEGGLDEVETNTVPG